MLCYNKSAPVRRAFVLRVLCMRRSLIIISVVCFIVGCIIGVFSSGYQLEGGSLPRTEYVLTKNIQTTFHDYNGVAKLSDLMTTDWDYVCMFERPDASSDTYAGVYAENYLRDHGIQGVMHIPKSVKGKEISVLVFIKDKDLVYTYYNKEDTIRISGKKTPFWAQAECAGRDRAFLKALPRENKSNRAEVADRIIVFDDEQ